MATSCGTSGPDQEKEEEKTVVPFTEGIRIAWDYRTLNRVYNGAVFYPRIIRLQNGDLLCAFESEGAIHITRSSDEGTNWTEAKIVAPSEGEVISAVPELIQLGNGDILLAYNTRPPRDNQNPENKFGIKLRTSKDAGKTWSSQQNVYEGGYKWNRGVWEPAMIQLSSGEIQLFFANEHPYANSGDQEISMVRSLDNGENWTEPSTISYRSGHRDGMPVPLILKNDAGIAVAIEDNGMDSGHFKPAIVWSSPEDNWEQAPVIGSSDQRWRALVEEHQLSPADYGGAPYLQQLAGGQTLLSFQSTESREGDWTNSTMVVAIGDERAKNFSRKSRPFQVPEYRSALWSSLLIKNDTTVTAVTSTTAYNASRRELYTIDGYVVGEMKASRGEVEVDGKQNEDVWNRSSINFIGAYSPANATISTAWDDEYLYVAFLVNDAHLYEAPNGSVGQSNGVAVMFAGGLLGSDALVNGTYKILCTPSEKVATFRGREGAWNHHHIEVDVASEVNESAGDSPGYRLEMAIPWSEVGGRPEEEQPWGINFELINRDQSTYQTYHETISGNEQGKPSTWTKIELVR